MVFSKCPMKLFKTMEGYYLEKKNPAHFIDDEVIAI